MKGPFLLPAKIKEGDYIEIGNTGAYGRAIAEEQFEPAGFALTLGLKDVNLARAAAGLGADIVMGGSGAFGNAATRLAASSNSPGTSRKNERIIQTAIGRFIEV